jgi:hypothetical protein
MSLTSQVWLFRCFGESGRGLSHLRLPARLSGHDHNGASSIKTRRAGSSDSRELPDRSPQSGVPGRINHLRCQYAHASLPRRVWSAAFTSVIASGSATNVASANSFSPMVIGSKDLPRERSSDPAPTRQVVTAQLAKSSKPSGISRVEYASAEPFTCSLSKPRQCGCRSSLRIPV